MSVGWWWGAIRWQQQSGIKTAISSVCVCVCLKISTMCLNWVFKREKTNKGIQERKKNLTLLLDDDDSGKQLKKTAEISFTHQWKQLFATKSSHTHTDNQVKLNQLNFEKFFFFFKYYWLCWFRISDWFEYWWVFFHLLIFFRHHFFSGTKKLIYYFHFFYVCVCV